ncbi:unnamed protein product, partial [Dovyalis caffra]
AGLIFNPAVLPKGVSNALFSKLGAGNLVTAATMGYQLFMFQSGVKMDLEMLKTVEGKVLFVGALCVLLPLLLGVATLTIMTEQEYLINFFTATTYSMSSFPVIVSLLNDLKLLNSELGRLGLSTALVSDLVGLLLLIISSLLRTADQEPNEIGDALIAMFVFIVTVALVLRPALNLLARKISDSLKELYVYFIISLFLGSVLLSHFFGLAVFYGPFIVGLAVPSGPPLGSAVLEKFEAITGYILTIFVTTCGMRVDFANTKFDKIQLNIAAISLGVISLAKFLVCYVGHSFFWESRAKHSAAFAFIMCAKGVVELALYTFLDDTEAIMDDAFIFMVGTVIVFGSFVPILVRRLYNPTKRYRGCLKRNLIDSGPNSELQIISCIHAPGDVNAVINLLDPSCSGDCPIAVTVLHHIKLVGQSTPLFISHRKERVIVCDYLHSVNVIRLFNEFEQNNSGLVSVNAVTAVSPPTFMCDDIFTLAVEKLASLIILPFHIRWWKQDGSIQSEDHNLRELNNKVLEKAPCSVGILVDRYSNRWLVYKDDAPTIIKVAMIFLGGNDDREALTFAIRMAQDTRVKLCVLHLIATIDEGRVIRDLNEFEAKQDNVALKEAKEKEYITYIKEVVDGATTTFSIIKSMVHEYELIIVGRRYNLDDITPQTSGLKQWCEYPELGLIGDLIISEDTMAECSLFVVQQVREQEEVQQQQQAAK